MDERQEKLHERSLRITTGERLDQCSSGMRTPTNENHRSGQRKMDFLFSTPRRKSQQGFEPYIPPHRRYQTPVNGNLDGNGIEKSNHIVKPLVPRDLSNSNSEFINGSEYTDSKLKYATSYNNNHFKSYSTSLSNGSSSNKNVEANKKGSHRSINKFYDYESDSTISMSFTNNIIVDRILKLIHTNVNAGLKKIIDGLYEQTYGESLPSEFLNRCEFSVTLKDNLQSSTTNRKISDSSMKMELPITKSVPDNLELSSLEKEFWINVLYCKSVSELWGIIMDSNHLGKVEELSNQMHSLYGQSKNPNNKVVQNAYYALLDGSWHRVKCLQCNDSTATVLFIDRGDVDEVSTNQLHKLSPQFCTVPAQAVKLSLTGLDIFSDLDDLQSILIRELCDKSVFVNVIAVTKDHLSVKLYITNNNGEVINVNELIMNEMLDKLLDPKLYIQTNSIIPARISYLENRIYIQLNMPSLRYFNLLMEKATEELIINEDCLRQIVVRHDINKIYFVKSNRDEKWYRGKIIKFITDNEIKVFLIDIGSTTEVNRKNIISLEKVCNILAKYPPQAIEIQLHQIPILGSKMISSIQNVVLRNPMLHVKFVTIGDNNNISAVQLLKKTESNFFTSINDALLFLNEETAIKKEDMAELGKSVQSIDISSNKDYSSSSIQSIKSSKSSKTLSETVLTKSRQSIDTLSNKDHDTSSALSTKSFKSSKTISDAEGKTLLKIDKEKISKIREMHKNTQKNGEHKQMYLSAVLKGPKIPDDYFDVHVVMSSDPSNFIIQLLRNKTLKFNKMICKMSETCRNYQGPILTCDSIKVGQLYACKSSENNNRDWCRAFVTEITEKNTAFVYCCDYGSRKNVAICDMVPLDTEFYNLPYQAIWAELSGVKPVMKEWTVVACMKFQELTQSKNFVSRVVSQRDTESNTLENPSNRPVIKEVIYSIELIDTSSNEDIDIAELLIQYGMAERC